MKKDNIIFGSLLLVLLLVFYGCMKKEEPIYANFDKEDNLMRPMDYRAWVFAGTGTTPQFLNVGHDGFSDFQNVYIDPVSFEFWKENGYFREGTILVKEVIAAIDQTDIPIGTTLLQGKVLRASAMVKDTVRFPDAPGGWEYFSFTNPDGTFKKQTNKVGVERACIACHALTKAGHGPFVEHQAPLRDAQGFGKGSPENLDDRSSLPSNQLKLLRDKDPKDFSFQCMNLPKQQ